MTDFNADGRPDLVIAVNDGSLVALVNNSPKSNRTFTVRLKGKKGNLGAVGARVTLQMKDGSKRTAEVYAGGVTSRNRRTSSILGSANRGMSTVSWSAGRTSGRSPIR